MSGAQRVRDSVAAIAAELGGRVGVAACNLASQAAVHLNADELFPMASCFKVPVMVEVMRQVDAGALRLGERLTLREQDKSPGGVLIHLHEGLRLTVRDLLYLMITLSDNTATDMLWRRVGLGSVNDTMRRLCLDIDCSMPNREYYLIEDGAVAEWRGLDGPQMVERWRAIEARGEHDEAFRRAREENERLSGAGFQRLSDRRWGRDEELGYDDAFAFDQALDNQGSPRAMAELLAMIAEQRCASGALLPPDDRDHEPAGMAREDPRRPAGRPARGQQDGRRVRHEQRRRHHRHAVRRAARHGRLLQGTLAGAARPRAAGDRGHGPRAVPASRRRGVKLAGARCVVVGGVHRLGRTVGLDLAAHGAAVAISSRRRSDELEAAVAALRAAGAPAAAGVDGDVRDPEGARRLVADAAAALGGLDALVFAASGPFVPHQPQDIDGAAWDASLDTIAKGFFFCACAARDLFAASGD